MNKQNEDIDYKDEIVKMVYEIGHENVIEYIYIIVKDIYEKIKRSE